MIIRCAWCKEWLGEKEPLDDLDITDTICPKCLEELKPRWESERILHDMARGEGLEGQFMAEQWA